MESAVAAASAEWAKLRTPAAAPPQVAPQTVAPPTVAEMRPAVPAATPSSGEPAQPVTAAAPPQVPAAEPSAPARSTEPPVQNAREGSVAPPAAEARQPQVAAAVPAVEPSRFAFAERSMTVSEGETSARIAIRRTGSLAEKESVVWWTANRSALADEDYAVLGARIEVFAPGEEVRVVHVPLIADSMPEQRESFVVNLRAERPGAGSAGQLEVTIVDDDS